MTRNSVCVRAMRADQGSPQFRGSLLPKPASVIYNIRSIRIQTEVQVKLLGWIKTAVELVKMPATARQVGPPRDAPHEIDDHARPQDSSSDGTDNRPEIPIDVAPEIAVSIERESRIS